MKRTQRRALAVKRSAAVDEFGSSPLRLAIVVLVVAKIVGLILFVSLDGYDGFQFPKSTLSRAIEVVVLAALLLGIARYGWRVAPTSRLHLSVAGYVLANVLSAALAENSYLAVYGDVTRLEGLTYLIDMMVLYVAVAVAFRELRDWLLLLAAAGAAGIASIGYALVQFTGLDPISWAGRPDIRPFGTFGNADLFGHFLALSCGAAVGAALVGRDQRLRIAAVAYAAAALLAGGLSGTRAFLVAILAIAVAAVLVYWRTGGRIAVRPLAFGLVGFVLAAGLLLFASPVGGRLIGSVSQAETVNDRIAIYSTSWQAFLARPLVGWGPDNVAPATVANRQLFAQAWFGPTVQYTSAHDLLLQALVTSGALGAAALIAMTAAFGWTLFARGLRTAPPVAAPLLLAFVGYETEALLSVGCICVDWLPWVAFGGTVSITSRRLVLSNRSRHPYWSDALALGAAAVVAILLVAPPYRANDAAGLSFRSTNARLYAQGVQYASFAVELDPNRVRNWERLGKTRAAAGQYRLAADAFAEAASRAPYFFENWSNLAVTRTAQAQSGDLSGGGLSAARSAVESGLRHDPNNALLLYTYAYVLDALGQPEAAAASANRAISLYAGESSYDVMVAQATSHVKDASVARSLLDRALASKDSVTLRLAAARAALRAGDRGAATAHVDHILKVLDPSNAEAQTLMRQLQAG